MGGNVEAIKERLDIAEVIGGYIKLEKAGANFKAKCPFHNEKTASFFISTPRQSYYCFGCGAKGDIFTFVEEMEGVDFKDALKTLADRAGVILKYESSGNKDEKDKLFKALRDAMQFFETGLEKSGEARKYLKSRGVNGESTSDWHLGFVPDNWRGLREHMMSLGWDDTTLTKAGLIKKSEDHKDKEPYDVFRGRVMFPIFDPRGEVIAFSGRALGNDTLPKYLNSPDTPLFMKSDVLYGLDKAREEIRRKDYAVLVEGQLDLVLSHQEGVKNTVASSGTAFTREHLLRLKKISPRIILAFDADAAGMKAAERSAALALSLGMEVKIATLPEGKDPADLVKEGGDAWKETLRASKPAIEVFLGKVLAEEKDIRKASKLIEKKILPLISILPSAMERTYYVSLIAKRTGMKESAIEEDLRKVKMAEPLAHTVQDSASDAHAVSVPLKVRIEEELEVLKDLQKDLDKTSKEFSSSERKVLELESRLRQLMLEERRQELQVKLFGGEATEALIKEVEGISKQLDEERRKLL